MKHFKKPLVSISLITYNSCKYVLDTLESIKLQTYSPIELVISDDCSTDDTLNICKEWIEQNKLRFYNTKIVVAPNNCGISANYNRGMDNCQGDYIKEIAGDDLLLPNCIEDFVNFINSNPDAYFCFGKVIVFGNDPQKIKRFKDEIFQDYNFFNLSSLEQLKHLILISNPIPSAVFFYSRKRMYELGIRNDERIPFMEDWPKWINILKKGEKLSFLNKEVSKYRVSSTQLSTNGEKRWFDQMFLLYKYYQFKETFRFNKLLGIKRLIRGWLIYMGLMK